VKVRVLILFVSLDAQAAPPDHDALLARMKESAVTYADRLQDFTCTRLMTRSGDQSGTGKHWKQLETQEQELNYVGHTENYKLLKVNGDPKNPEKRVKSGYMKSSGQFSGAFRGILDPVVKAEFTWDRVDDSSGKRLCVFQYHVPEASSKMVMKVGRQKIVFGNHGSLHVDCESGAVMRVEMETDPTPPKPASWQVDIRYGWTAIAGKEFLLPQTSSETSRAGKTLTKGEIRFVGYRKYGAESSVSFDAPRDH
jgi:hypothetical protein